MSIQENIRVKDFPHVMAVVTAVANRKGCKKADSLESAYFYQLRAAHRVDVFEPFTVDQRLLNGLLSELKAGKECCQHAWELYAQKAAA